MAELFEGSDDDQKRLLVMHFVENRLASFQDWPFEKGCCCTPEKMAEAGFYHCPTENEPDLVKCFVCLKELDGWEPTDDPWDEHKSHSGHCAFLQLKNPNHMTVGDLLKLEKERYLNIFTKISEGKIQALEEHIAQAKEQLTNMI